MSFFASLRARRKQITFIVVSSGIYCAILFGFISYFAVPADAEPRALEINLVMLLILAAGATALALFQAISGSWLNGDKGDSSIATDMVILALVFMAAWLEISLIKSLGVSRLL